MPILPFYAESFGASAVQLGAILSVYAGMVVTNRFFSNSEALVDLR